MKKYTKKAILESYEKNGGDIKKRLENFKNLPEERYFDEFIFCMLTPQSNAKKCWEAVEQLKKLKKADRKTIAGILKSRTRFHNNKARYLLKARGNWKFILPELKNPNKQGLRNFLVDNVDGYGLKEASHFLRNIGKSDSQLAILDRHILRNLVELGVINCRKIKSKKEYLKTEKKFLDFAREIGIPADELDLLFWSNENGEIFK
jgi:N-glycosylase/DNA lyase